MRIRNPKNAQGLDLATAQDVKGAAKKADAAITKAEGAALAVEELDGEVQGLSDEVGTLDGRVTSLDSQAVKDGSVSGAGYGVSLSGGKSGSNINVSLSVEKATLNSDFEFGPGAVFATGPDVQTAINAAVAKVPHGGGAQVTVESDLVAVNGVITLQNASGSEEIHVISIKETSSGTPETWEGEVDESAGTIRVWSQDKAPVDASTLRFTVTYIAASQGVTVEKELSPVAGLITLQQAGSFTSVHVLSVVDSTGMSWNGEVDETAKTVRVWGPTETPPGTIPTFNVAYIGS